MPQDSFSVGRSGLTHLSLVYVVANYSYVGVCSKSDDADVIVIVSVLLLVRCDCFITYQQSACALEQGRSNEVDPAMLQVPQDWEPKCRRIRVETGAWYPPDESRFGRCCCSLLLELEPCSVSVSCHLSSLCWCWCVPI